MASPTAAAVELHRLEEGSGPALLLLHGLGGDHTIWNGIVPALRTHAHVIAPDLRGHGRSPAPPGSSFRFAEHGADLLELLDRSGVKRVHVAGLSAGALLALQFTLDHPERVASLVSIAGAVNIDNHTRAIVDRWVETYRTDGFEAYVLRLAKDLYYPDWIEAHLDIVDRLREQTAELDLGHVVQWREEIRQFDLRGRVGKIRAPTLIVHAMDDQVMDVAHARLLRQSIPGAELRLFAQTGHLIPVERPGEVATLLAAWVHKVEGASPSAGADAPD